jgi:tRNA modification GTPase
MINSTNTITALSSGKGKSAIAAIRISGEDAFSIVGKCLEPSKAFQKCPTNNILLYRFISPPTQRTIDQITAVKYKAPQSYTGEDMVELFCHGNEIIIEKILSELIKNGAVIAEKGEFTRRAYLNGKLDLVKAEAIQGLIDSRAEKQHEAAIDIYMGGYKQKLLQWKNTIKEILRDIEAEIEFPEEDDVRNNKKEQIKKIVKTRKEIELEVKKKEKSEVIEKGINVPIVGITNAGKSSLFNLLLESDRSIVHREEGTTRDMVGEDILLAGEKIRLLDTAGLRNTENPVEKIGIKKTWEYIHNTALFIWVTPADAHITEHEMVLIKEKGKKICVISKTDLMNGKTKKEFCRKNGIPCIGASLTDKQERERIVGFIGKWVEKTLGSFVFSNIIRNQRQRYIAKRMAERLHTVESLCDPGEEILSLHLRNVLDDIGDFVGETTNEEILNSIFSEFCIGK